MYYKWKPYVWFLRNVVQQTEFFLILDHFCPFTPLATQTTKILKNYKKMPGDLILHTCTINDNQMMYCSWDIKHDRENFSVILSHFLSFYSTKNQKNLNFEKTKKKLGDIITLHKCTKNHDYKLYCFWDMVCNKCNFYFYSWAIFCPFTPNSPKSKIY